MQLYVTPPEQCPATAIALSALIADKIEADLLKTFFKISLPITGAVFGGSGYYAYNHLGGDDNLTATFWFALFVCFRVFDLMSDWGMYAVSLASQHRGTPLRHACMAFSIIGSILLILDLKTMRERGERWFGVTDSSESLQRIGYGMLAIVLLEDVPQLSITCVYLSEIVAAGRPVDAIAVASLVLSVTSMLANAIIAIRSLCRFSGYCTQTEHPTARRTAGPSAGAGAEAAVRADEVVHATAAPHVSNPSFEIDSSSSSNDAPQTSTAGDQRCKQCNTKIQFCTCHVRRTTSDMSTRGRNATVDKQKAQTRCIQKTSTGPCQKNSTLGSTRCVDHTCSLKGCSHAKSSRVEYCKVHAAGSSA